MLWYGAENGAFDLRAVLMETLTGMRRAGETFTARILCITMAKWGCFKVLSACNPNMRPPYWKLDSE